MQIDTLKTRIENAEKKITKINGTLERHNKGLEKIKNNLINKGIDLSNYNKYSDEVRNNNDLYWDLCDYEHKLEDIDRNKDKLKEATNSLEKLKNTLEVEIKKNDNIDNVIPPCLIEFLEMWKARAKEFYANLCKEYIELRMRSYEVTKEELNNLYTQRYNSKTHKLEMVRRYSDENIPTILNSENHKCEAEEYIREKYVNQFRNNHFASDIAVMDKIINYKSVDMETLEKILDYEVKIKKESFVTRVQEVVGVIEDMNNFEIGIDGEINGIAIGKKCKAKVKTIGAGGYNIQCYHYRVLVNKIKEV